MHNTFTLKGHHTTGSGVPHLGMVRVTPNTTISDPSGGVVMSGPEVVSLDGTGAWSLTLPCDSPGLNPSSGIGYTVVYQLAATVMDQQAFAATSALAGTVLDVSQISGGAVPTAPTTITVGPQIAYDTDGIPYLTS